MIMRKFQNFLNKHFGSRLDADSIKRFKVMMKHVNSNDSIISTNSSGQDYIVSNPITHYDLIFTDDKIQLVNTTDVIDILVGDHIRNRVLARVRSNMDRERREHIDRILSRREYNLDKILTQI